MTSPSLKNSLRFHFNRHSLVGILAGLMAGALWGLVFIAPDLVKVDTAEGISSIDLVSGRFLTYGIAAALTMLISPRAKYPTRVQLQSAIKLSILGFSGYYLLLIFSIRDVGIHIPTLIVGTIPFWVMLFGKPHYLQWRMLIPALAITTLGIVLMAFVQLPTANHSIKNSIDRSFSSDWASHFVFGRGILLASLSTASWTYFSLLNSKWLKQNHPISVTDWTNWLGISAALGSLILWILFGTPFNQLILKSNIVYYLITCVVTGLGAAWLATILWNIASQRLSASLCGQLIVSETIFALLYAFVLQAKVPSLLEILACVFFILGIWMSIKAHKS